LVAHTPAGAVSVQGFAIVNLLSSHLASLFGVGINIWSWHYTHRGGSIVSSKTFYRFFLYIYLRLDCISTLQLSRLLTTKSIHLEGVLFPTIAVDHTVFPAPPILSL
jgi:hypothetical protein